MKSELGIYIYMAPAAAVIFSAAFFGAWLLQPQRRYILFFCVCFMAFAMGLLSQFLNIPSTGEANILVSGGLYTFAVLCLIEGAKARVKVTGGDALLFGIAGAIMMFLYYYFYVDRDLAMRIYAQNFGYGLMFVVAAVQIARPSQRRGADKLVFWLLLIFGLHFFPRTLLTMSISGDLHHLEKAGGAYDRDAVRAAFGRTPFWLVLNFSLLISSLLAFLALLGAVVADVIEESRQEGNADPLTSLANRRGFLRRVKAISGDPSRLSMSVVYCDIDHFKSINDTYGHLVGDQVLQQFARLLQSEIRPQDVAARLGGEEFVVLLMDANLSGAHVFAERVRQEVELARFPGLPQQASVTASFGIAQWRPGENLLAVMSRADTLVYEAKRAGRNRIAVEPHNVGNVEGEG
ncbi:GGDEF domain-containing protein [Xanthobacter pseudotagetidis]|uniref:GGDEF domain-containing protein n=1 Tax=Xanthobacter pseudotagetidis TaxID=3119911 RepID=UPI003728BEC6